MLRQIKVKNPAFDYDVDKHISLDNSHYQQCKICGYGVAGVVVLGRQPFLQSNGSVESKCREFSIEACLQRYEYGVDTIYLYLQGYSFFLILALKHRLGVLVRTAH